MPYCRHGRLALTLQMVVARPHRDGERDANLHARSARRAPRSGARRCRMTQRQRCASDPGSAHLLCRSVRAATLAAAPRRGGSRPCWPTRSGRSHW